MYVQIAVAVVSGFIGALLKEYIVSPIRTYKNIRRKISKDLVKYGDVIGNPGSVANVRASEARTVFRDDAAELHSVRDSMPNAVLKLFLTMPEEDELEEAEDRLIRLSNIVQGSGVDRNDDVSTADDDRGKVREQLNLEE